MFRKQSVSVIIPTWNESAGIAYTLQSVPSLVDEVIVVDGCSTDGTCEIAKANGARVFSENRRGYGRAFRTGFNAAKGDLLVSADGDGTYPLGSLPSLLEHLVSRDQLFVSCSRFPLKDSRTMRFRNVFGNRVITMAASLLWNETFSDILSGMWAMRREAWVRLDTISDSWNFSEEIKLRAFELFGPRFSEFHIHYAERLGTTKLTPWRVGIENLVWLALMRLDLERQFKALLSPKPKRFRKDSPPIESPSDDSASAPTNLQ
jgi:glycosyltransferase involved in cell wall biosynthesis